jgi:hypothetical protein
MTQGAAQYGDPPSQGALSTLEQTRGGVPVQAQPEQRLVPADPEVRLLVPRSDVADPEISIVIPALNEERTIVEFVEWCKEGISEAGVRGEILIVSSSSDRTDELALEHGARVLSTPKRGLGRAYIDATPYIRGRYVMVGDADCTYDFREIAPFIEKLREGYDFVMGSRFKGTIEPKAMPPHHRYFGTPITNWIFNVVQNKAHFSDIHCGMRGLTRETYLKIDLQSQGWEYASEMILKAVHMGLKTTEIPINFYRDRNGRVSTVKRRGWLTPWKAGWDSLRINFTYGADFFLFRPGLLLSVLGLAAVAWMTPGPVTVGSTQLTSNSQFLAVAVSIIGMSAVYLGILAQVINDRTGRAGTIWLRRFPYNRTYLISASMSVVGFVLDAILLGVYISDHLTLPPSAARVVHLGTTGMLLMMLGFLTFTFTLVLHALTTRLSRSAEVAR